MHSRAYCVRTKANPGTNFYCTIHSTWLKNFYETRKSAEAESDKRKNKHEAYFLFQTTNLKCLLRVTETP